VDLIGVATDKDPASRLLLILKRLEAGSTTRIAYSHLLAKPGN
jgi:hypothetical protein